MGNLLEFLLENGGCSIRYRIKREILKEDKTSNEMVALHNEIMNRPRVRKIFRPARGRVDRKGIAWLSGARVGFKCCVFIKQGCGKGFGANEESSPGPASR